MPPYTTARALYATLVSVSVGAALFCGCEKEQQPQNAQTIAQNTDSAVASSIQMREVFHDDAGNCYRLIGGHSYSGTSISIVGLVSSTCQ